MFDIQQDQIEPLKNLISEELKDLVNLIKFKNNNKYLRALSFQLYENNGVLKRDNIKDIVDSISKEDRKQLVGILTVDPSIVLEEGSHLVEVETSLPMPMVGHITSSYYSPNLGRSIALGLVKSGTRKKGAKLIVPSVNKSIEVEITNPVFIESFLLDKEQKIQN